LLGRGDGTFDPPSFCPAGYYANSSEALAVADFDSDGLPDIAVPSFYDWYAVVLLNQPYIPTLELLDAEGNVLASGVVGSDGLDLAMVDFIAPADGVYYVRVGGHGARDYSLVVTRSAEPGGASFPLQTASASSSGAAEAIAGLALAAAPSDAGADAAADLGVIPTTVGRLPVGASRATGTGLDYFDRAIDSLAVAPPSHPSVGVAMKTQVVRPPVVAGVIAAPQPVPWKRSTAARSRYSSVTV
jgi:hypothetical protein